MLATMAQALLDAAVDSGVTVERSYLAGAPGWAKVCRSLVVHLDSLEAAGMPTTAAFASLPGGAGCPVVPVATFHVTFVAACYPAADVSPGGTPSIPDAAALTAWTADALGDLAAVQQAVVGALGTDPFDDYDVQPGPALPPGGPLGGHVWWPLAIRVALTAGPRW